MRSIAERRRASLFVSSAARSVPRRLVACLPALLVLALLSAAATGQLPRRYDCGDLNGYATGEPGYQLVTETSAPPGVSIVPAPLDTVHVAHFFPALHGGPPLGVVYPVDTLVTDPDQLGETHRNTALKLAQNAVVSVSGLAPHTKHRVKLELGALHPWIDLDANNQFEFHLDAVSREVTVDVQDPFDTPPISWRRAARDIRCSTAYKGNTLASPVSGQVTVWVLAQSDSAGVLRVRLASEAGDPVYLAAFEVHGYTDLPVRYRRTASGPLQALTPGVQPFVTAFNAGNFAAARTAALSIANPFERGTALLHLVGWLDGSRAGAFDLLDAARTALGVALPNQPSAAWLLDEIATLQRALDHKAASGYDWANQCPDEGGFGFFNDACGPRVNTFAGAAWANPNAHVAVRELRGIVAPVHGRTVLEDLVGWNAGASSLSLWEPSPVVFAALKMTGTLLVDVNPLLSVIPSDPESVEQNTRARDIFEDFIDLGFATVDFPRDLELRLFDAYVAGGQHPSQWSLAQVQDLFTPAEIAASWWGQDVALVPEDPAAPKWANLQRNLARLVGSLTDYWLGDRVQQNELGGGWGDDIELMAQLGPMLAWRRDQTTRRARDTLDRMIQYGLHEQGDVADGYYAGLAVDVQHTAEYTTNTWTSTRGPFGHSATAHEIALGVIEHLRWTQDPSEAFTGLTSLGRRHFRSLVYNAEGPDTDPAYTMDILLNGRTLVPGVGTGGATVLPVAHPLLQDQIALANGMRADADDTSGGKPVGWFTSTQFPSNAFGKNGIWYSESGNPADASILNQGFHSYGLSLLHLAHRRTGNWTYLVPAARIFRSVMNWEKAGSPAGSTGSLAWVASRFKASPRFGPLVVDAVGYLSGTPTLATQIDPHTGAPYVDTALITHMREWVEVEFTNQSNAIRYALVEPNPCGMGVKPTNPLWGPYESAIAYYRALWPILTTHVIHTDRAVFNYIGSGPNTLLAGATGTQLIEGVPLRPFVRWEARLDDGLDVAIQTNHRPYDGTAYRAFAYNFENQPVDVTLELDEGLVPGTYRVEWGDAATCDDFPAGASIASTTVTKRGIGLPVDVTLPAGPGMVKITRIGGAAAPAGYDLALDGPVIEVRRAPGKLDLVFRARVVNAGGAPSPAATCRLTATVILPDGQPLALPGMPLQLDLGTHSVPPLAGASGWTLDEDDVELVVPLTANLVLALNLGLGFMLDAEIEAGGTEGDLLNNRQARGWTLEDMTVYTPFGPK